MLRNTRQMRLALLYIVVLSLGSALSFLIMYLVTINRIRPTYSGLPVNPNADSTFLLVLILTAPANLDRRNTIRQTWLPLRNRIDPSLQDSLKKKIELPTYNKQGFIEPPALTSQAAFKDTQPEVRKPTSRLEYQTIPVIHKFVVGTLGTTRSQLNQIHYEQANEKDILIIPDLQDSYSNLTQKLLMSIAAITYDHKFEYILKCDDDSYVNLDRLTAELFAYDNLLKHQNYAPNPRPELYWGYFNGKANIKRSGKWQETNFKGCDLYSPYALGGGYVISAGIAFYISENWQILSPYVSEDVAMGAWLGHLRHVYRKHDVRFDSGYLPRKCKPYHLLVHKRSEREMKLLRGGDLCSFEETDLHGKQRPVEYYYDWTAPPSKCCVPNIE